jgi:hypothetical protein
MSYSAFTKLDGTTNCTYDTASKQLTISINNNSSYYSIGTFTYTYIDPLIPIATASTTTITGDVDLLYTVVTTFANGNSTRTLTDQT